MGSPVSRLQQPRAEQPQLYHLAADTINLYPLPDSDSVWSHQNKPAAECQSHLDMGRTYEKQALTFEAKHPEGTLGVSHCKYWADLDLRQAKEAPALAARHEEMAKAAEQKQ